MPILTTHYLPLRLLPTQRNLLSTVNRVRLAVLGETPSVHGLANSLRARLRRPVLLPAFEGMTTPPATHFLEKTTCPYSAEKPSNGRHGIPRLLWDAGERRRREL
ncbi:MAG: hypothetical protein AB7P76_00760 [Candidatus Melainabacteria bacterium]